MVSEYIMDSKAKRTLNSIINDNIYTLYEDKIVVHTEDKLDPELVRLVGIMKQRTSLS